MNDGNFGAFEKRGQEAGHGEPFCEACQQHRPCSCDDMADDIEACPGCGCRPGDGLTPGCSHPDGCGYFTACEHEWTEAVDDTGRLVEPAADICVHCGQVRR